MSMNFVPKEKSREAIKNLLERCQKEREQEEAERRRNYLCEKYGE